MSSLRFEQLIRKGVQAWNNWRIEHRNDVPNLSFANLAGLDIRGAKFHDVLFHRTIMNSVNAANASFRRARFEGAYLDHGVFNEADFSQAKFERVALPPLPCTAKRADFVKARFDSAHIVDCDFSESILTEAVLEGALLNRVKVRGVMFRRCRFGATVLVDLNLADVFELASTEHSLPSAVTISTLRESHGRISVDFLSHCGFGVGELAFSALYNQHLTLDEIADAVNTIQMVRGESPVQIKGVFISYASSDAEFTECLRRELEKHGLVCFLDTHDLLAGRIETQLTRAIGLQSVFILVLSERSIASDWVQWEVSKAREEERVRHQDMLCPVALDDSWKKAQWPGPLRFQIEQYNILDFSSWKDNSAFAIQFKKLFQGLQLYYRSRDAGSA